MNKIKLPTENLPLYYNKKYNGFHVVHSIDYDNQKAIIGGCCTFLNDAFSNNMRYKIKLSSFNNLQRLEKKTVNKYDFVEADCSLIKGVVIFRIKKELEDKTYLFFQDECVLARFSV